MLKNFLFYFFEFCLYFYSSSVRICCRRILVQVDFVWDTSRFPFAVSFSFHVLIMGLFDRHHVVTFFVGLVSGYFIGFFRPLVGGFLFENTSRYQMMSFEKTNFLQRIREVLNYFENLCFGIDHFRRRLFSFEFSVDFLRSLTPFVRM